jgi:hypothetical protein
LRAQPAVNAITIIRRIFNQIFVTPLPLLLIIKIITASGINGWMKVPIVAVRRKLSYGYNDIAKTENNPKRTINAEMILIIFFVPIIVSSLLV